MRSKSWIIICLVVILSGFQQIRAAFAFNLPKTFVLKKNPDSFRVMQWNVHNWNQVKPDNGRRFDMNAYPAMMDLVKKYNGDVLCFEEFAEHLSRKKYPSNIATLKKMGYPYYYFLDNGMMENEYKAGVAVFSKFPIVDSGKVRLVKKTNTDPPAYVDIQNGDKRFRVIIIHLQSVHFKNEQYEQLSEMRKAKRPDIQGSKTIIAKLKKGFQIRNVQAASVSRQVEESPYPVMVCGDFNDVPNSGTYFTITKNLQDAFIKKGSFIGRTFRFISPTLRIDYILPDKNFKVEQFARIRAPYSDHYPIVADLKF